MPSGLLYTSVIAAANATTDALGSYSECVTPQGHDAHLGGLQAEATYHSPPQIARITGSPRQQQHASASLLLFFACCACRGQLCDMTWGLRQGGLRGVDLRWRGRSNNTGTGVNNSPSAVTPEQNQPPVRLTRVPVLGGERAPFVSPCTPRSDLSRGEAAVHHQL